MDQKRRVIGYDDRKWYIDPPIEDIKSWWHWKFWVLGKQPLFKSTWNITDYHLTDHCNFKYFNFFQYFCRLKTYIYSLVDRMFYQLHFNTGVNMVLLQSFFLSSRLTYGKENNHSKYFMYSSYLCIKPCLLAHGCIRWALPLVVLVVIGKLNLKNIVYRTALSLDWYGNIS